MRPVRIGTFIKTGSPHVVEVLGTAGLDFGVLDQEHGPFDRSTLDLMMLAGRAAGLPLFVRIPEIAAAPVLGALDLGAAGLIVPHVDTPEMAAQAVRYAKFKSGERGFAPGGRWGNYGTIGVADALALGDRAEVLCMIESPAAVENAAAIAATPGVAGLFIGRGDLCVAMGLTDPNDARVTAASRVAIAAGRAAGVAVAVFLQSVDEAPALLDEGADMLIVQSDQTLMRLAARQMAATARASGVKPAGRLDGQVDG